MMRVTRLVVVLALGLLPLSSHADADDIRRDALQGSTAAQYEMGILYEFGFHLAEHEIEALAWYSVAAERGNQLMGIETENRLVDFILARADKMSMANSLELRTPFLDYRLIEFSRRIPVRWKVNPKELFCNHHQFGINNFS